LGYSSKEEYFKEFFSTLLNTNKSVNFFVDWNKVYKHIQEHLDEISLLNGLVNIKNSDDRRKHLEEVLIKYPKTRAILPLIIATRDEKLEVLSFSKNDAIIYNEIDFNNGEIKKILQFCDETGVVELLVIIKDLHSYLTGVEVGMDTNARKNRSGTMFEDLVLTSLKKKGVDIRKADKKIDLGRSKKPDLFIYKNNKIFAIVEVNFYGGQGSKPLETIQSYITLQHEANNRSVKFILITDGPAWKTAIKERELAFDQIDYPFNFNLALKLIPKM
jgi:type II restriction enzyme